MKETIENDLQLQIDFLNQRINNMGRCFKEMKQVIGNLQKEIELFKESKSITNEPIEGQEIWYDIEGWEGYYQISSLGRVKSLPRILKGRNNNIYRIPTERIMKIFKTKYDIYPYVIFSKDSEKYKVYIKDIKIKNI